MIQCLVCVTCSPEFLEQMNKDMKTFFIDRKEANVMIQVRSDLVSKNLGKDSEKDSQWACLLAL